MEPREIHHSVVVSLVDTCAYCEAPLPNLVRWCLVWCIDRLVSLCGIKFRALVSVAQRHTVGGMPVTIPIGLRVLGEGETAHLESAVHWLQNNKLLLEGARQRN